MLGAACSLVATPNLVVHRRVVKPELARPSPARTDADWSRLVLLTAGGSQAALAQLYDASSHLVFGLALRILGDRDAAEDVVIDVYARAWREAKTYDPQRGTPCAWLLTMTRSRAIDLLRVHKRDRATDPLEFASEVECGAPTPEEASADAERHRVVRSALTSLSREQREPIELAYFAGLSHTEIAMQLGQPLGTIKTRIRLGMMRLRELLGHLSEPVMAGSKETA
jgi:RNA polymerase sigma-70 factor (ECF subfamily)